MKFGPHKSSIFDLDANVVAMLVYLLPWLFGFASSSLSTIIWIIPLLVFILEKKSSFVTYHSANSLAFYVLEAIIYIISSILGITAVLTSLISKVNFIGFISLGITGILFLIIGFIFIVTKLCLFIGKIICTIKAYDYQEVNFPIINKITNIILNLKR